jgi:anaerobic magnesium-protoporphyrin IX monomethyl ester cyclase
MWRPESGAVDYNLFTSLGWVLSCSHSLFRPWSDRERSSRKRMKVMFLNAPGVSPADTPWMGVPQLVAYLKQRGYTDTHQRDLDLDLFYRSLEDETLERVVALVRRHRRSMSSSAPWWKRWVVRWLAVPVLTRIARYELRDREYLEHFRAATPVGEWFPEEGQERYRRTLNGVLKLFGLYFYPHLAYPRFFSLREESVYKRLYLRLGNYLFETMDLGNRALQDFYERHVVPDLLREDYDVIGISVLVQRQYDTALLLAKTLRENGVRAKLVLGGSFITNTYDSEWLEDDVVRQVDYVVLYEGEQAVHALVQSIERGEDPADVINLVYFRGDERVETRRDFLRDINELPAPDYDGLPLDLYLDRPLRLPIMGNRGCYWGKCTFCVHFWSLGTGRMRLRSAENQLSDMKTLMSKYGTNTFYFTDETIELNEAERLSRMILDEGLDVNWGSMVRLEEQLTEDYLRLVRSAGFYLMLFGLESINQRIQDIIRKGVDISTAWRILRDCEKLGIKVNLFMILGIPGETEEEMRENVDFMRDNTELFETLHITTFELFKKAPMERFHEDYAIDDPHVVGGHLQTAYNEIKFETREGLSREKVAAWRRRVDRMPVLIDKDMFGGLGYRVFQPEPSGKKFPSVVDVKRVS